MGEMNKDWTEKHVKLKYFENPPENRIIAQSI